MCGFLIVAPMEGHEPSRRVRRRDILLFDYALLILAAGSAVIGVIAFSPGLEPLEKGAIRYVDYAAIILFGFFFAAKLVRSGKPIAFAKENWFGLAGLLPLTEPLLIPDRFWIVVQIIIVTSRVSVALDRALGERVLLGVFARYKAMIVEELTDPILDRLLAIIQQALVRGRYLESLGQSLDERRPLIRESVRKSIEASPKLSKLSTLGPVKRYIDSTIEEAVDAAVVALTSEEMNRLVAESLDRALADFRGTVQDRAWRKKGYGFTDVASGIFRGEMRTDRDQTKNAK